jgi:hypothetical protein
LELFLLLSALICGFTGTVKSVIVRAPEAVVAQQQVAAVEAAETVTFAMSALAMAGRVLMPARPDGYVAAAPLALEPILVRLDVRAAFARRRE